jgi:NADPH:quinone reductase-like Zn-dependent oxidoreductase
MARVVRFHRIGGPEVLPIEDLEVGDPGPGEIKIRVEAIGLNRAEAMFRSGTYLEEPRLPARLGYEASGIVEVLGPGVSGLKAGDAISVIPACSLNQYGVYGEEAIVPASAVVRAMDGPGSVTPPRSGPDHHLDRPPLVHRRIAGRHYSENSDHYMIAFIAAPTIFIHLDDAWHH